MKRLTFEVPDDTRLAFLCFVTTDAKGGRLWNRAVSTEDIDKGEVIVCKEDAKEENNATNT